MAMSKTKSLRRHATRRAAERYEINLNQYDLAYMANQARRGTGLFVERQSNRLTKWLVKLPKVNKVAPIIYDSNRRTVVTVLPRQAMPHPASELGCRARALELSQEDVAGIVAQIQDGRAIRGAGRHNRGLTEWVVLKPSSGAEIAILHHRGKGTIDSVLTVPTPDQRACMEVSSEVPSAEIATSPVAP